MKILLTHGYFLEEDEKEKRIMKPYVPLGILYVSAFLEANGFPNEVFDSTFSSFAKLEKALLATKPAVVGIYVNLMTKVNVLRLIRFIRREQALSGTKIILGGPEVRNHAEKFLQAGADILVIGEGEETMLDAVKNITGDLSSVKGITWKDAEGKIIVNDERKLLKNMDELPFPDRKKVNLRLYFDAWKNAHGYSTVSMSTMRGCPYTCKWCSRAVYGLSYRRRSPALVADEIAELKKNYSFDNIWFVDDVFTISHKWLREFANELRVRAMKISYEIITRADRMNEEVIQLLKESGCVRIWIGAESGSQAVIDAMDRRVDVKQVRDMIRLTKANGMQAGTFIMLGYPGETENDIRATIDHLATSDPDHFTITVAYPIKGTSLYEEVQHNFLEAPEWENSTDRDIDFKRTYPRKYYDYAVRWVSNEVAFRKSLKRKSFISLPVLKLKSLTARAAMQLLK